MKMCIIGAGGAGLCSARHCLESGHEIAVFERTEHMGGTWNYTQYVGTDQNGLPVHTAMYKGLRTNLPKELMTLEDFPYPEEQELSYIGQEEVLKYFNEYAKNFLLEPHIKFLKEVVEVNRSEDRWKVVIRDVKSGVQDEFFFDAVVICNGHYSVPFRPKFEGDFLGRISHSHEYRTPEGFKEKRVLLVGCGPSGIDIARQIAPFAAKLCLSHRSEQEIPKLPEEVVEKGNISRFEGNSVQFIDGTSEIFDEVMLCTGYLYSFPFLRNCGIKTIENRYVFPLHKQVINIEQPTMAFIGLPYTVCPMPMFDIQIRFFLASISGWYQLPSKEILFQQLDEEMEEKKDRPKTKYHQIGGGEEQERYFNDLATSANIKKIPKAISLLYGRIRMGRNGGECFDCR